MYAQLNHYQVYRTASFRNSMPDLYHPASPRRQFHDEDDYLSTNKGQTLHQVHYNEGPPGTSDNLSYGIIYHTSLDTEIYHDPNGVPHNS